MRALQMVVSIHNSPTLLGRARAAGTAFCTVSNTNFWDQSWAILGPISGNHGLLFWVYFGCCNNNFNDNSTVLFHGIYNFNCRRAGLAEELVDLHVVVVQHLNFSVFAHGVFDLYNFDYNVNYVNLNSDVVRRSQPQQPIFDFSGWLVLGAMRLFTTMPFYYLFVIC